MGRLLNPLLQRESIDDWSAVAREPEPEPATNPASAPKPRAEYVTSAKRRELRDMARQTGICDENDHPNFSWLLMLLAALYTGSQDVQILAKWTKQMPVWLAVGKQRLLDNGIWGGNGEFYFERLDFDTPEGRQYFVVELTLQVLVAAGDVVRVSD